MKTAWEKGQGSTIWPANDEEVQEPTFLKMCHQMSEGSRASVYMRVRECGCAHLRLSVGGCACVCCGGAHKHMCECVVCVNVCVCLYTKEDEPENAH